MRAHDPKLFQRPPELSAMPCSFGKTPFSPKEEEVISVNLRRNLGPEYISTRSGPGGSKLTYLEGWKAINLANEIFGFNGWSTSIMQVSVDYEENNSGKINLGISAIVRVTLKDGTFREDVGFGSIENAKSRANAYEKARKEAITDSVKRALKSFGSALGGCFYDKDYLRKIQHCKVPQKASITMSELYRAPEFRESKVDLKTVRNEEAYLGNHSPQKDGPTSTTVPLLPVAIDESVPIEPVPLAGDIEVLDEEFLCDFSSQDERMLLAAAAENMNNHRKENFSDVNNLKHVQVTTSKRNQVHPQGDCPTTLIERASENSIAKQQSFEFDSCSKSIAYTTASSSTNSSCSIHSKQTSSHLLVPFKLPQPSPQKPKTFKNTSVPLRMISPQRQNAPPNLMPAKNVNCLLFSGDDNPIKKQRRNFYDDIDIPGFT